MATMVRMRLAAAFALLLAVTGGAGEGPRRLVYSYVYNHLVQLLFHLRLRDMKIWISPNTKTTTRRVISGPSGPVRAM